MNLLKTFKESPTEQQIFAVKHNCVVCGEPWQGVCGTPQIRLGGCCVGYEDDEKKQRVLVPRTAHLECWLDHHKD